MPRVTFQNVWDNINITKPMRSPKKIQDLERWYKQARVAIPQIPSKDGLDGWYLHNEEVSEKWIKWSLRNSQDERCYIVIDRKYDSVGMVST